MKNYFILVLIFIFFVSCIPTKDLTYFQGSPSESNKIKEIAYRPYRLQVHDIIDIRIKATDENLVTLFNASNKLENAVITKEKLYFDSYSVDENGMIRIPYLGEINVLGYTTKEVRSKIEDKLSLIFKNMDDIFVKVKLAGVKFTVLGEVSKPGTNTLFQNDVNILEAIASSGDILMTGDRKNVVVVRNNADGVKKIILDLTKFNFINNKGYYIQPNDVIYIKPLKQKSWGTGDTGAKTFSTIVTALSVLTTTILLFKTL
jgi:polysaccharide export outer membrane protein